MFQQRYVGGNALESGVREPRDKVKRRMQRQTDVSVAQNSHSRKTFATSAKASDQTSGKRDLLLRPRRLLFYIENKSYLPGIHRWR